MTTTNQSSQHRLRLVAVLVTLVAVIAAALVYVVMRIPSYRTAFLLDTAASTPSGAGADFYAVADAVSSAAQNAGDRDALSLRRFGGACGDSHNTDQIVNSGTHHGQQISDAVHTLTPSGAATLQSGILAAIDDFSGFYPSRGRKSNRIIAVTSHGIDACTADQATLMKTIRDRIDAAGLQLDFRFVGYKIPSEQQHTLTQIAAATGAPKPKFAQTKADLTAILKQLTIPESSGAALARIPTATRKSTVVPVDKSVNPLPGYRVNSRVDIDYVDCGSPQSDPSLASVGANIVSCIPFAALADVCWTRPDRRTVLCGQDPWNKVLYQYIARDPISPVSAAKDPLPWGLELEDGTKCRLRNGEAWGGRSDNLIGAYDCGHDHDPVLVSQPAVTQGIDVTQVIDKSLPTWTVQVGPLDDSTASPPPRKLGVVVAYFAGSPS